jgi:hypothetical protein
MSAVLFQQLNCFFPQVALYGALFASIPKKDKKRKRETNKQTPRL